MSTKARLGKKIFKGGAILSFAQGVGQICSVGRNVIIARLVTPADFGIASTFIMVVVLLEMISNLSLDRLLVQAVDGEEPGFQETAHLLQAIRGIVLTCILLVAAPHLADLFSIPEAIDSFYVLAFLPLLTSFNHLDVKRFERVLNFGPGAIIELSSQFVMLICAYPIGMLFGDYRSMLVLLAIKSLILLVGTHLVAQRTFRLRMVKPFARRFVVFGWPLLINGLLMFGTMQGDRFIITSAKSLFDSPYDMSDVGLFSAALSLTMVPSIMLSRVGSVFFLPLLSHPEKLGLDIGKLLSVLSSSVALLVASLGSTLIIFGDGFVSLLYGVNYNSAGDLVLWLSVMWSIKTLRVLPASFSIAKNNTKNLMYSNLIRFISLIGVLFVVAAKLPIVWIVWAGIFGELMAFGGIVLLNYVDFLLKPLMFFKHLACVIFIFILGVVGKVGILPQIKSSNFMVSIVFLCCLLAMLSMLLKDEMSWLVRKGAALCKG